MSDVDTKHTTLYRLFNATGSLLYVGIAGNPGRRFQQHASDKAWWGEVARVALEHHASREAASEAERKAIASEQPRYNIALVPSSPVQSGPKRVMVRCSGCGLPIDDGQGYIEVDLAEVGLVATERQAIEERCTRFDLGARVLVYLTADLLALPTPVSWLAWHGKCDPAPESDTYWWAVESFRTLSDVFRWTAHLMEKEWFFDTAWDDVMHQMSATVDASSGPVFYRRGPRKDES